MFTAKIPAKKHTSVMSSFWAMMKQLETQADNSNNAFEKHTVESYFEQWNELMTDTAEPSWVHRAKKSA